MTNQDRITHANAVIDFYHSPKNQDREDALRDLLADLMHWADEHLPQYGRTFEKELAGAAMNYEAERDEESEQDAQDAVT